MCDAVAYICMVYICLYEGNSALAAHLLQHARSCQVWTDQDEASSGLDPGGVLEALLQVRSRLRSPTPSLFRNVFGAPKV